MNNHLVEQQMKRAYDALRECGIAKEKTPGKGDYQISRDFRGKIAAYGAAITMGSLLSGTAFYSEQGNADSERQNLMRAIYWILHEGVPVENVDKTSLFQFIVQNNNRRTRERILAAATALKLSMNLYTLVPERAEGQPP